jgi:chromate transporter
MCGPTCVFAFFVGRSFDRFRGAVWHGVVSGGLIPVTLGLTAASGIVVASASDRSWVAVAITVVTAIVCYRVRIHPLWVFAVAAVLGAFGLV